MSKVYLVNPNESRILDNAGDRKPVGILSIASCMREKGHDVSVYDLNHDSEEELLYNADRERPDAIGISVYTSPILQESLELAEKLKNHRLIAGGYHATAMPQSLRPFFDAVVQGEGENALEKALKQDGIISADRPDLNKTPNPANLNHPYGINGKQGTIITSRGCPYSCSFCGNMNHKVRFEPLEKVKQQLQEIKEQGYESVYFLDDMFTLKKDRVKAISEMCKELDLPFRATTRANHLDDSKLETLAANGCELISLGVESGDDKILKNINKRETTREIYEAVQKCEEHGIKTKGFFIIGLPGETKETAEKTIDFSTELRYHGMHRADFYYLTPFPGTPIWNNPEKFGITIKDRDFSKYLQAGKESKCVIETEQLNSEEIEGLVKKAKKNWHDYFDDLGY